MGRTAWIETEGLFGYPQFLRGDCMHRSEENGCLHSARAVQDQDPHEASHQSRNQKRLRQGGEGCSQACEKSSQGFPGGRSEERDLDWLVRICRRAILEA